MLAAAGVAASVANHSGFGVFDSGLDCILARHSSDIRCYSKFLVLFDADRLPSINNPPTVAGVDILAESNGRHRGGLSRPHTAWRS